MIIKGLMFIFGVIVLGFLFLVNNAMSKPLYNKMHNVWEEDPEGKKYANITLIVMLLIAFFMGLMF
jgi:Na+(H+)/acetate symporter ActP